MSTETETVGHYAMSDEKRDLESTMGIGVDYKTLFLGACTLIVLLGGAAFRIWDTGAQRNYDHLQYTLNKLTERVAELETRHIENRFRIANLERLAERK